MVYTDLDSGKKAFIFELDNVLYPEKDYLLQVYYLFASYLEYTEQIDAKDLLAVMQTAFFKQGKEKVYPILSEKFNLDSKYERNFEHLLVHAQLPLKLLLFKEMLTLLQDIVIDRKKIFIVTGGNPAQQLNKIKYTEWNGLENYLRCYFADEVKPKPELDAIICLLNENDLKRRDILMIGNSETDELTAEAAGIDHLNVENFLTHS